MDTKLLKINKSLFRYLKKKFRKVSRTYENEPYNYNIKVKHDKLKKYIDNLLLINDIDSGYFYNPEQYKIDDQDDNLNKYVEKLWSFDINRFIYIVDFKLNLQEKISDNDTIDNSPYPLFNYLNEDKFKIPSYKYFFRVCNLFTKYIGISEEQTKYKRALIDKFINKIINTKVFVYLYHILKKKKIIKNFLDFHEYIFNIWFTTYSKKASDDSCLFEHIFVGEMSQNKVLGLHNWIRFYNEEKIGRINYFGHYNTVNDYPYILSMKFSWERKIKHLSTFLIGTSIEFEMALYTLLNIYATSNTITISYNNIDTTFKIIKKNNHIITIYPHVLSEKII
jgi:poly(U)-specific endoribonuclease